MRSILLFFFNDAGISNILQVSVKTQKGKPLIWHLFNIPLGMDADGLRLILSIAQDISSNIKQKHTETLTNQLEQPISTRTETLSTIIATLEKEIIEKNSISNALTLSRERLKKIFLVYPTISAVIWRYNDILFHRNFRARHS